MRSWIRNQETGVADCRKGKSPTLLNCNFLYWCFCLLTFMFCFQHFSPLRRASTPLRRRQVESIDIELVYHWVSKAHGWLSKIGMQLGLLPLLLPLNGRKFSVLAVSGGRFKKQNEMTLMAVPAYQSASATPRMPGRRIAAPEHPGLRSAQFWLASEW